MRKIISKIYRYTIRTVLVLLLLVVLGLTAFYVYINTGSGRRFLASEISTYLGKTLGTEISIKSATWEFPASVSLEHVVIKDHRHKNMFVIERLNAGLAFYNFVTQRITLSEVTIRDVNFDLVRYPGDSSSNFGYVINRLTAGGDTAKKASTDIMFNVVNIENLHFTWDDQNLGRISYKGIDWNHLDVSKVNGRFTYFWINGNDISAKIKKFSLEEGSGFVLNNLEGIAKYTPKTLEIKSLGLQTPWSQIGNYLKLDYPDPESMVDFVSNVNIEASFSNSIISYKDLSFFTPDLKNKSDFVNIANLEASGKISDLHIHDIDAAFGKNSFVKGKIDIKGLPNIDETFIAARFSKTKTSRQELEQLLPEIELPAELDKLGIITVKGNFTGFINDFVTYGEFETAIGKGSSDLNMKIDKNPALCTYSGKLSLDAFNIGALFNEPLLGLMTMNGKLEGKGLTLESVRANLDASISQMDFKKYSYHNINILGRVASKFFNGFVKVHDKSLTLNFNGSIDYTHQKPEFNFTADIPNANLYELNLAQDSFLLATTVKINVRGIHPDDIDGQIFATNTKVFIPGRNYIFDSININSAITSHYRDIHIYSNIVQANISGDFLLSQAGDLLKSVANQYLDSDFLHVKVEPPKNQYVNFDIHFLNLEPVFSILRTKITVADSGYIKGSIYANDNKVNLEGNFPAIKYKDMQFNKIVLNGKGDNNYLALEVDVGSFVNKDSMLVRDATIKLRSNKDKLFFDIYGADQLRQKQAWLKGTFDVEGKLAYLDLDSSNLRVLKDDWHLSAKRITFYKDTMMDAPLITLNNGQQTIRIAGQYSAKTSYPVRIVTENLGLVSIATFVPELQGFTGALNGQVTINNINTKPIVDAAVYIETLVYKQDTLGTISASTSYNENNKKLSVDAKLETRNQQLEATARGDITMDQRQALALNVNLNQTDIKIFEPLISDIFSELKGLANADIAITGYLNEPLISGNIEFNNAEFKVNYTNVKYHFSHNMSFGGRMIYIKNLALYDTYNNLGTVNGKFDLTRLDNVKMNLEINAKKLMGLNTTQKLNDLYFGKAFGTGKVSIDGPLDNLKFVIKMRTEKNTTFSMPISSGNTFYGHDYIKFINKGSYLKGTRSVKLTGIELYMDLDITPDAYAQIIFDPRVGDIIEAHGTGNLRLDVNSDGDFSMYGTYSITDGKYRFTAFDIINKSFVINPGSTISWNGNPYDAQLNVNAIYSVRTTLSALHSQAFGSSSTQESLNDYNRVYPVDALLYLKGSLLHPEIKLDFEIKDLYAGSSISTEVENTVRQIRNNEQDLNQQVVSLLMLNSFIPVDQVGFHAGLGNETLTTSVGDLISNQLNYWLSKASEDLHVGIDIRSQEELSLRISQDIFKQRANISGSYDVQYNNYNTQLSYKIRPDGSLQARIFGRSNNNPLINQNSNTQGIGILYRREFDKVSELFRKRINRPKPNL
jgi:hypothetical protein